MHESIIIITGVHPMIKVDADLMVTITSCFGKLSCSSGVVKRWPHIFKLVIMYFSLFSLFNVPHFDTMSDMKGSHAAGGPFS